MAGLRICIEGLEDRGNRAAILRSADAFGLLHVHEMPSERGASGVCNGGEKWLVVHRHESASECAAALKGDGFALYAAVVDDPDAVPLEALDFSRRIALVFGNERAGLTTGLRSACDGAFTIRMRGLSESLNVSVAGGILLYALLSSRRAAP